MRQFYRSSLKTKKLSPDAAAAVTQLADPAPEASPPSTRIPAEAVQSGLSDPRSEAEKTRSIAPVTLGKLHAQIRVKRNQAPVDPQVPSVYMRDTSPFLDDIEALTSGIKLRTLLQRRQKTEHLLRHHMVKIGHTGR